MSGKVEIRFRMASGPFKVLAAASRLRGMNVTAFVQHAIANELKTGGDYDRFVTSDITEVIFNNADKRVIDRGN